MVINRENIEIVAEYQYLGRIIDNKLQWTCNTDTIYKKGLQTAEVEFYAQAKTI